MTETVQFIRTVADCGWCPNRESKRFHTADVFDTVDEWTCKAHHNKRIALRSNWNDNKQAIPKWCPLRPKVKAQGD
jgi:hypothetical protein